MAKTLQKTREDIIELNMFSDTDSNIGAIARTYFGQEIVSCPLREMWDDVKHRASFEQRRREIDEFNRNNKFHKRGLSMVPVKFGMSFTLKFMVSETLLSG